VANVIDAKEALARVLFYQLNAKIVTVPLEESLSRILAEEVFADIDQPPFHRVTMDGIAINKNQLLTTKKFKILKTISAGTEGSELPVGEVCFEIMTGAVLPLNADLVIRYEDLKIADGVAEIIVDLQSLNSNFHDQGSDYPKGALLLSAGTSIKSTIITILASAGKTHVKVFAIPKVAILSTGDELVEIGTNPKPHQIRWSNGISLQQELLSHGFSEVSLHRVGDNENDMQKMMSELLTSKDILLLTGGVSAGKYDFVPKVLKECQVMEIFHQVAQRPGKPLWFGKTAVDAFVFGLPGNPVSCLVNLRKFVVPFLQKSVHGNAKNQPKAFLTADVKFGANLTYYCPVKIKNEEGKLLAEPISGNGSGDFFHLRDADGFIELRPQDAPFKEGFLGEVYLWGKS
jgi:molybdopterin molybdotransferase